jgi:hypothetical protein
MPRCRSGKLSRYGDLTGRSVARWHQPADESADDIVPMRDGDDTRPASGMTRSPRSTFWPRKAKPSAIGGGRCKADVLLLQPLLVLMPQLATWVVREWVRRGRRSR